MKKTVTLFLSALILISFSACSNNAQPQKEEINSGETTENTSAPQSFKTMSDDITGLSVEKKETADYSDLFQYINGCAVFYGEKDKTLTLYNEEDCRMRYSPYSTFKIPAALIGLENRVLISQETKMNYSGEKYLFDSWNKDLNLKEAFSVSCVWYFRQAINKIGQENMQSALNALNYGNCDISEWEGNLINEQKDTNGFWLGSSLEISPVEQVEVLESIFENKTDFSQNSISILKDIMYCDDINNASVYGKTGSGKDNSAWFTGFAESNGDKTYFAIHLDDKNAENIAGAKAKEISYSIIEKYFSGN